MCDPSRRQFVALSLAGGLGVAMRSNAHLLASRIRARLYFAIASDDDAREPEAKHRLRETFAAAGVPAEIEVFPKARLGWCVPDNEAANNTRDAKRAWAKLVGLYRSAL